MSHFYANNLTWKYAFMINKFIHKFFIIISLCPGIVLADSVLKLDDLKSEYALGKYISVLEDSSRKLTIKEITQPKFADKYQSFNQDRPGLGFSTSIFWIRLQLKNESKIGY